MKLYCQSRGGRRADRIAGCHACPNLAGTACDELSRGPLYDLEQFFFDLTSCSAAGGWAEPLNLCYVKVYFDA